MSYLPQLLVLAGVWAIVVITPGPNFVATVHHAIARSRRNGVFVALGITTGTTIWVTFSIVGLGILFARFSWLVEIIRMVGALYLAYLGVRMILNARRPLNISLSKEVSSRRVSSWRVGFFTDISNPKAAAFFGGLFAALLPASPPLWVQIACIVIVVAIAACWYCVVACLFSLGPVARTYRRAKRWIDYITGGVFIALGARLATTK